MSQESNSTTNRVEQEYLDLVSKNGWALAYQRIGMESQRFNFTLNEAKKPQNKPLNRYRDVNPYDHTRVVLKRCNQDYINANFVTLERANRRYILTQGPLAFSLGHFWLMIWEQNSKAILMLNKIIEKNEIKCHWYWPQQPGDAHKMSFNGVKLSVTLLKEEDCRYYITRHLRLEDEESGTHRDIIHFHYTTWPDFGVPSSPDAFLRFLKRVRESGVLEGDGPPVIHCSAGIGRSGTFCLVDCCLVIVEKEGIDQVDIQETLLELRKYRMGLIQTVDQLRFSYQAVIEGYRRMDPSYKDQGEEEESIYNNVEEDEVPPPPPPRAASLRQAPARPLPAKPSNLNETSTVEAASSDESSYLSVSASSADDEDDDAEAPPLPTSTPTELRRRQKRPASDRLKRRGTEHETEGDERWQALKRLKTEEESSED